ncbi:oxidoreductase, short chain dehydrogenase/reductase family protein [Bacteriovorax sp. BSW11_IV]|uniref:enoyl-ACP reductase FabI n=1 Tax=Bacteriovorax sp. BSW11_IV TaxID=1353529 RepID=UPI000389EDF0|nr:SDR family oxidoreductase [Bacteriovorax sp. BSW11_IV]EQC50301.1 oxidoreductase, short chain dehydrogenase/reductase family protein [Bacteriovorax sp. BSW11_IV]
MDFLGVKDKTFVVAGVSNRKSVAFFSAKILAEAGANIIFTAQSNDHFERVSKLFPNSEVFVLDVENEEDIQRFGQKIKEKGTPIDGLLHSIAFANLVEGKSFHETSLKDFQQATQISCFSLVQMSNALKDSFAKDASVVTISISDTRATSYGYMGPVKAMLDATVAYLAKSFSSFSRVRFNSVGSGPLKTSASAGIPGYVNNYIFAEKLTLRKEALATEEVANTVAFLMSPRSSGVNATGILVDAGMSCNHFDESVVKTVADFS